MMNIHVEYLYIDIINIYILDLRQYAASAFGYILFCMKQDDLIKVRLILRASLVKAATAAARPHVNDNRRRV